MHRGAYTERRGSECRCANQGGECDNRKTDRGDDANPGWQHHETSVDLGCAVNGVSAAMASAAMTLSSTVISTAPEAPRTRSNPAASATALTPCRIGAYANSRGGAKGSERQTGST